MEVKDITNRDVDFANGIQMYVESRFSRLFKCKGKYDN